jgi:hypothetical protein
MNRTPFVLTSAAVLLAVSAVLTACTSAPLAPPFSQASLPAAVQVPAGNKVSLETVGVGEITYACRAKANSTDAFEWVFVGPKAELRARSGKVIGSYYGPPATWQHQDGSKLTGAQVAVSPAAAGSIPLQLVKANAATSTGAITGTTFIQRVATQGGVAPAVACTGANAGQQQIVKYQADYIFYKAAM